LRGKQRDRRNHLGIVVYRKGRMHADSTKLAAPLEDRTAALRGLVETGMDTGRSQSRAMVGGLAYQYSQLGVAVACTDKKALSVEEETCMEDSCWGTLHADGELHQAGRRWIRRQHDACRVG